LVAAWEKGVLFKLRLVPGYHGQESARATYLPPGGMAGRRLAGLGIGGLNLCILACAESIIGMGTAANLPYERIAMTDLRVS
jgi:hypothetical protein